MFHFCYYWENGTPSTPYIFRFVASIRLKLVESILFISIERFRVLSLLHCLYIAFWSMSFLFFVFHFAVPCRAEYSNCCSTFGLCPACTIIFLLSTTFLLTMLPILFPSTGVLSSRTKCREPRSCLEQRNFMPTRASRPPQDPFIQASHQPQPMPPSRRCPSHNHQLPPPSPLLQYPAVRLASTTSSTARSGRLLVPTTRTSLESILSGFLYVPRPVSSL
jgi:hypothetical protein